MILRFRCVYGVQWLQTVVRLQAIPLGTLGAPPQDPEVLLTLLELLPLVLLVLLVLAVAPEEPEPERPAETSVSFLECFNASFYTV